ncbi:hypothetical protein MANES_09G117050v8 [Manihot esculenta]|uniref:Uncharacterized protein n=1 Tax=Manihot esculenta TaxID=3983 RepID=A0ACB7H7M7_MANES|nr:hypothetical protein MANES_09G117050v8 [Manihot esculenta]
MHSFPTHALPLFLSFSKSFEDPVICNVISELEEKGW